MAASYGVGALGGLVYLRLLNRSVDSVGGGVGGALGQPRLLIPVILALGYNRCVCGAGEMEFVGTRKGHGQPRPRQRAQQGYLSTPLGVPRCAGTTRW